MEIQSVNKMMLASWLLLLTNISFGQTKQSNVPFIIVSDIKKRNYYYGDSICFSVKNKTQTSRGYTIEAFRLYKNLRSNMPIKSELYMTLQLIVAQLFILLFKEKK